MLEERNWSWHEICFQYNEKMGFQLVGSREKIFSSLKMGKIKEIMKGEIEDFYWNWGNIRLSHLFQEKQTTNWWNIFRSLGTLPLTIIFEVKIRKKELKVKGEK